MAKGAKIVIIIFAAMIAIALFADVYFQSFGFSSSADKKLFWALGGYGNAEAAREAIAEGANINRFGGTLGDTIGNNKRERNPLRLACENYNTLRVAYILLENGANPNTVDVRGWTTFANVVSMDDIDLCKKMLEKGANVNLTGKNGMSSLDACFFIDGAAAERMYDFLVQNGAEVTPENLRYATTYQDSWYSDYRYIQYSLVRKIVIELERTEQTIDIDPLIKAVLLGDEDRAMQLLQDKTKRDKRCLFFAAAYGTPEMLEALLKEGRELDEKDLNGYSLLAIAAKCGNTRMLEYLIPKFNLKGTDDGRKALAEAVLYDQIDAVRLLIDSNASFDLDIYSSACLNGNADMLKLLLSSSEGSKSGYAQAMETACRYDQAECLKLLIEAGADVNKGFNSNGYKPLVEAADWGSLECVKMLLQNNADITGDGGYWSPLTRACMSGHIEVAEYLIEQGADVNFAIDNKIEDLPLYNAISTGELDCIKLLVENGAVIDDENLYQAKLSGSDNVYQYLLSASQKTVKAA